MKIFKPQLVPAKSLGQMLALEMFVPDRRIILRETPGDRRLFLRPTHDLKLIGASVAALAFGALCTVCHLIQILATP